jgi:precorrin-2/cobalt-factor-2 C20-methyltransferase
MSAAAGTIGCLYGVGLGPGDPDLVTVKAAKILKSVPVIAFFAKKGASGRARAIFGHWVSSNCQQLPLIYPVTTEVHFCDPAYAAQLLTFYRDGAGAIAAYLSAGEDVALVCEGDPFFYGSFIHLFLRLRDRFKIEIIPGVTGISGCWSAAKTPIAWGDDVLSVLPGTLDYSDLVCYLRASRAAVIIKIGANLAKIRAAAGEAGRLPTALYVEHGTSDSQIIMPLGDKPDCRAPYFSTILIPGRGRDL